MSITNVVEVGVAIITTTDSASSVYNSPNSISVVSSTG